METSKYEEILKEWYKHKMLFPQLAREIKLEIYLQKSMQLSLSLKDAYHQQIRKEEMHYEQFVAQRAELNPEKLGKEYYVRALKAKEAELLQEIQETERESESIVESINIERNKLLEKEKILKDEFKKTYNNGYQFYEKLMETRKTEAMFVKSRQVICLGPLRLKYLIIRIKESVEKNNLKSVKVEQEIEQKILKLNEFLRKLLFKICNLMNEVKMDVTVLNEIFETISIKERELKRMILPITLSVAQYELERAWEEEEYKVVKFIKSIRRGEIEVNQINCRRLIVGSNTFENHLSLAFELLELYEIYCANLFTIKNTSPLQSHIVEGRKLLMSLQKKFNHEELFSEEECEEIREKLLLLTPKMPTEGQLLHYMQHFYCLEKNKYLRCFPFYNNEKLSALIFNKIYEAEKQNSMTNTPFPKLVYNKMDFIFITENNKQQCYHIDESLSVLMEKENHFEGLIHKIKQAKKPLGYNFVNQLNEELNANEHLSFIPKYAELITLIHSSLKESPESSPSTSPIEEVVEVSEESMHKAVLESFKEHLESRLKGHPRISLTECKEMLATLKAMDVEVKKLLEYENVLDMMQAICEEIDYNAT